ncbi:hypothetical protein ACLB2K_035072 [Fragaria x ananassa]
MPQYAGNSDPHDHMDSIQTVTSERECSDTLQCQLFNQTLEGEAMSWFFEQSPNSVNSFDELRVAFLSRFVLQAKCGQGTEGLFKVKQQPGETLRSFVTRWQSETSKCKNLTRKRPWQHLKRACTRGSF